MFSSSNFNFAFLRSSGLTDPFTIAQGNSQGVVVGVLGTAHWNWHIPKGESAGDGCNFFVAYPVSCPLSMMEPPYVILEDVGSSDGRKRAF